MIVEPKLIHDREGFIHILARLKAQPVGNLRQDLLRQVISLHETDRHRIFVLAVGIAVVELQNHV